MKSEHTKDMTDEERRALQKEVESYDDDKLVEFRNSFEADNMGFSGEEGEIE
nr:MAG TPA: RPAP1-like protein [Caudoviricetes sp.]